MKITEMVKPIILMFALLLLLFEICNADDNKADAMFQRMLRLSQPVKFQGKLTIIFDSPRGHEASEALIYRVPPDKQRIEFISPEEIKGSGEIIIGKERFPLPPARREGGPGGPGRPRFFPMPPPDIQDSIPENMLILLNNYNIRLLEGGNIAERDTYLFEIEPKFAGRPSRKIWTDKQNGVILKMEHYNYQKKLQRLFIYSAISYNPNIDMNIFRKPENLPPQREQNRKEVWNYRQGKVNLENIREETKMNLIIPEQISPGFALQSIDLVEFRNFKNVHLKYTDGLAILSIFQSPFHERGGPGGDRREERRREPGDERNMRDREKIEKININGIETEIMFRGPIIISIWKYKDINMTLLAELKREEIIQIVGSLISLAKKQA